MALFVWMVSVRQLGAERNVKKEKRERLSFGSVLFLETESLIMKT